MGAAQTTATETTLPVELDQLPPRVAALLRPATDPVADGQYAAELARGHYENFSVISFLLPRRLRQDFCNVYGFCRTADDLGDELGSTELSTRALGWLREQTLLMYDGRTPTALFSALSRTVRRYDIPPAPFLDLIDAFEQDQRVTRYETFDQVLDYCRRSANPVGRLVLYLCGYRDAQRQELSDQTCSALQLANFWQDVASDLRDRDRIYLPRESMARFAVSEAQIAQGRFDSHYRDLLKFEVDRAQAMFDAGDALLPLLDDSIRPQVSLFARGGRAILTAIRRLDYDTLSRRPVVSRLQKAGLMVRAALAGLRQMGGRDS